MSTRAVIFDVDGTLIDTNDLHTAAWVEAFRRFGVEVDPEDIRRQMGKGGDQLMPSFLPPDLLQQKGHDLERFRVDLFQRVYLPRARACGSCSSASEPTGIGSCSPPHPRRRRLSVTSPWPMSPI